jgi:fibronectin type 3 domain-containing protein
LGKTARLASTLVVVASGSVAVLAVEAAPAAAADCVISDLLVNSCRPWLGAAANGYPGVNGTGAQILAHEQRIGRKLDIVHLYTPPGEMRLTDESVMFATRPDTILSVTWQPATRWVDASGNNATTNANINRMADSINALGSTKIMLTIHHEPENDVSGGGVGCSANKGYVGNTGTPAEYRTMWRTVRELFDAKGVDNVVWVMNYMGYSGWDCIVDDLYPGNDLVDWIKWDPYGEIVDFEALASRFYDYLARNSNAEYNYLSKPWGLAEWGSWHNATQNHAYMLNQTAKVAVETNRFPRLKAYSIFDVSGTCRIAYDRNGNYDAVEIARYREFAQSAVFRDPVVTEPDTEAPSTVADLGASAAADDVALDWTAATDNVGVTGYDVYRNGQLLATSGTDSYRDTTVSPGGTYTYTVRARDAAGNVGAASNEARITVDEEQPDTAAPTTPTGLTGTASNGQARLSWNAATDDTGVTAYVVYRDGVAIATVTSLSYVDGAVTAGRTYSYAVSARDAAGNESARSAPRTVAIPAGPDTTAPSTPTNFTATPGARRVTLNWSAATDNVGVAGYYVLRDGVRVATLSAGTLTYTNTGLTTGRQYVFQVRAYDAAGNKGSSAQVTARSN